MGLDDIRGGGGGEQQKGGYEGWILGVAGRREGWGCGEMKRGWACRKGVWDGDGVKAYQGLSSR